MALLVAPRLLRRRWYAVLVGLVLTAGLVAGAFLLVPPTYTARANVLLLPPKSSNQPNPYLGLGGLQEATDVLARSMSDVTVADKLTAAGATGTYTIYRDTSTAGPILQISADNKTAGGATKTVSVILDYIKPAFVELQRQAAGPSANLIELTVLTKDDTATVQRKAQLRAVIGAGAAGLVITVLLIALAENVSNRRAKRRTDEPSAPAVDALPRLRTLQEILPTSEEAPKRVAGRRRSSRGTAGRSGHRMDIGTDGSASMRKLADG